MTTCQTQEGWPQTHFLPVAICSSTVSFSPGTLLRDSLQDQLAEGTYPHLS